MTRLYTASWRTLFDASKLGPLPVLPVRISRGAPRFWPEAAQFPYIEEIAPDAWMMGLAEVDKFWRCYRRKLQTAGADAIGARLDDAIGDAPKAAVCCFEADAAHCHRGPRGFAGWWIEHTNERVPELTLMQCRDTGAAALVHEAQQAPCRGQQDGEGSDYESLD
ncbi:MAG: DUF488 family protein [Solirubrobacteraceae bacterium]